MIKSTRVQTWNLSSKNYVQTQLVLNLKKSKETKLNVFITTKEIHAHCDILEKKKFMLKLDSYYEWI